MKKLVTLLALTTVFSVQANPSLQGQLALQGVVTKKLSIEVTANPVASSLNLVQSQSDLLVGTVREKSNSNTGYKVKIASGNLGKLVRGGGTEAVNYSLKYDGSSVDLSTSAGQTFNHAGAQVVNEVKDIAISYTGTPEDSLVEGTYSDTVTFDISAI